MSEKVQAPFTPEQVDSLNGYQESGVFHEFTCGNNSDHDPLVATVSGWFCTQCGYRQGWAHAWMADRSWEGVQPNL